MFTTDDLADMRTAQEAVMMDTCELLCKAETGTDEYGMPKTGFTVSATSICGLNTTASREMLNAEAHFYDAKLRLPHDTVITNVDQVCITHRYGQLLQTPITYEILGSPIVGPSGMVLNLRSLA